MIQGGSAVGLSLDAGYVANEHAFVSLTTVDQAAAEPGTEVTVLWGEEPSSARPAVERHRQAGIRATVAPAPYVREVRDSYRTSWQARRQRGHQGLRSPVNRGGEDHRPVRRKDTR